jgi:23S rRNA (guanosine2251-2'-O)-methyltransferase
VSPPRRRGEPLPSAPGTRAARGAGGPGRGAGERRGGRDSKGSGQWLGGERVEGRRAVLELLRAGRRPVRRVLLADRGDRPGPLEEIVEAAAAAGIQVQRVGQERIDALAATSAPQGVIAEAAPLMACGLADLLGRDGSAFVVVLDGVTDPYNLGAVMRSALGAGASGLVRHRSARLSPATVKAAAGAVEHLPVALVAGVPAALSDLARAGVWTVGLDAEAPVALWGMAVLAEPVAVVLGSEGRGLSPLAARRCQILASIPMRGPLASLNVSAAAALACFEVNRLRAQAAIDN